jgi:hypothetical protein
MQLRLLRLFLGFAAFAWGIPAWGDGHVKASKSPQAFSNPALWGNNPTAINGGGPAPDAADRPKQFQKLFPAFNRELQVAHRAGTGFQI